MSEPQHHSINYIELPTDDMDATKQFYGKVFGWTFVDYGPDYASFNGAGIDGGFRGDGEVASRQPGALVVLYSERIEQSENAIVDAGGKIVVPTFEFPGGRRFHFTDPSGNELAVWST